MVRQADGIVVIEKHRERFYLKETGPGWALSTHPGPVSFFLTNIARATIKYLCFYHIEQDIGLDMLIKIGYIFIEFMQALS